MDTRKAVTMKKTNMEIIMKRKKEAKAVNMAIKKDTKKAPKLLDFITKRIKVKNHK